MNHPPPFLTVLTRSKNKTFSRARIPCFGIWTTKLEENSGKTSEDAMQGKGNKSKRQQPSLITTVYTSLRAAEFEIFFFLFFFIAFLLFRNLMSRPEYNQIMVKKPEHDFWPF